MTVKVLIVQLEAIAGDIKGNISKVTNMLSHSSFSSADLIVLPELWTIGWNCEKFNECSEDLDSSVLIPFLKELSVKYNSNVIGGTSIIRKPNEKDRNTSFIFNRKGEMTASYDKYHLFSHRGESEGTYLESGTTGLLVNTDIGKIGVSICYDIRFPELFRLYAFNGADIIVNMAAWPESFMDEYITLAKARAIENQTCFISSCLTGKINETYNFSGHSQALDYRGRIISKLEYEEKVLYAELDLEEMKQYRQQMPILKDTKEQYKIMEK
jgi:predicted amidohydrolase